MHSPGRPGNLRSQGLRCPLSTSVCSTAARWWRGRQLWSPTADAGGRCHAPPSRRGFGGTSLQPQAEACSTAQGTRCSMLGRALASGFADGGAVTGSAGYSDAAPQSGADTNAIAPRHRHATTDDVPSGIPTAGTRLPAKFDMGEVGRAVKPCRSPLAQHQRCGAHHACRRKTSVPPWSSRTASKWVCSGESRVSVSVTPPLCTVRWWLAAR